MRWRSWFDRRTFSMQTFKVVGSNKEQPGADIAALPLRRLISPPMLRDVECDKASDFNKCEKINVRNI